jgi:hypothetical protein
LPKPLYQKKVILVEFLGFEGYSPQRNKMLKCLCPLKYNLPLRLPNQMTQKAKKKKEKRKKKKEKNLSQPIAQINLLICQ